MCGLLPAVGLVGVCLGETCAVSRISCCASGELFLPILQSSGNRLTLQFSRQGVSVAAEAQPLLSHHSTKSSLSPSANANPRWRHGSRCDVGRGKESRSTVSRQHLPSRSRGRTRNILVV